MSAWSPIKEKSDFVQEDPGLGSPALFSDNLLCLDHKGLISLF